VSPYVVACADCGADIRWAGALGGRRDATLLWLLGGALLGAVVMHALT
jgi:hypothetical protein